MRQFVRLSGFVLCMAMAIGACGGNADESSADQSSADQSSADQSSAAPASSSTDASEAAAASTTAPGPAPTSTSAPADPPPAVEEATSVPTVANDSCDMVPFSTWDSAEGGRAQFGELTQFSVETPGGSRFGSWECSKGVVMALVDGAPVIGELAPEPSRIVIEGTEYVFNQAESSFQE